LINVDLRVRAWRGPPPIRALRQGAFALVRGILKKCARFFAGDWLR
jgi:hypothetical protein